MRIIEIKALSNGAHRNQSSENIQLLEGYAVIPENIETPNFPFGEIEVVEIDGVPTVTSWTATEIPEKKEAEKPVAAIEQLRADVDYIAIMTGVEL